MAQPQDAEANPMFFYSCMQWNVGDPALHSNPTPLHIVAHHMRSSADKSKEVCDILACFSGIYTPYEKRLQCPRQ